MKEGDSLTFEMVEFTNKVSLALGINFPGANEILFFF
jgi:hypothetical protein